MLNSNLSSIFIHVKKSTKINYSSDTVKAIAIGTSEFPSMKLLLQNVSAFHRSKLRTDLKAVFKFENNSLLLVLESNIAP